MGSKIFFSQYKTILRGRIYSGSFKDIDFDIITFMYKEYPDVFNVSYLKTSEGFTKAVQYIKDNSLYDDFFDFVRYKAEERFKDSIYNTLKGKKNS